MNPRRPRSPGRLRQSMAFMFVAAAALLGPASATARGQWVVTPGFGWPGGGFGYGYGFGYGFGPTYAGVGYGFGGVPWAGYGAGYGIYPGAFSVLNQPDIQSGLAYNALATGRAAPYAFASPIGPFGYGPGYGLNVGPYGYAGAAYYNPYFASGLTPLAVQSAQDELLLRRGGTPIRFRIVPVPAPAGGAEGEEAKAPE